MKAGADMRIAGKTLCVFVMLMITKLIRTAGNNEVLVTVGNSSVLTCSPKTNITMVTWKINPKAGGSCTLGYRADLNKTDRTNCSDNMNWKFRPDRDPALEIRQVGRAHEGIYTCEVVATEGNFHKTHHLTVQVPPRLTLYCAGHGSPVCEAVAGKPPAQISWVPQNNSTSREEGHVDGTVTVVSMFTASSTNMTYTTCIVSHPAGNQSKSIACGPSNNNGFIVLISIILCFLILITMAVVYYLRFQSDRLCHKTKSPETASPSSPQDDTMEVEPYTTYVQKENVIYNSVSDLTVGQNLPQGLLPAT
ncbi:cell surface glycoprotein CD200 receptor 1-A-like [Colius striatus]|uniref:cell surface glycoprotein CD200 receptor 1-A-like n=1 Tax=Colius striatus TaxID=57412 RepID=UPI002B1D4F8C|nr:cell surface glycoprotein CD200 receptor 1-A-like [Colius striatus]